MKLAFIQDDVQGLKQSKPSGATEKEKKIDCRFLSCACLRPVKPADEATGGRLSGFRVSYIILTSINIHVIYTPFVSYSC